MYVPAAFDVVSGAKILATLRRNPFGHLVTSTGAAPPSLNATPLPFVVDDDVTRLRAHFARANPHWQDIDGSPGLMIVPGPDAYVSPRWYPSKQEHGKVVPTWNYEVVHLHGTIRVHHKSGWKLALVSDLTNHNEKLVRDPTLEQRWQVSDAPDDFVDGQLKAIVGVELEITKIEAKRKLSQNRSRGDRSGAIEGLGRSHRPGDLSTADLMRSSESESTDVNAP